jgi:hypothetical protein
MVSLPKLERAVAARLAVGDAPDDAMRYLAGLTKVQYIFVYPDTGDLVLAGPAGAWHDDAEDRIVSAASGQPVLRLDDLVVVIRHVLGRVDSVFGCSIDPRPEGLAAVKAFVDAGIGKKLPAGEKARERWLDELGGKLGVQDIDVFGIDPRTRVARMLVEADYRMKLVGLGLEEGVLGVPNYLASVRVDKDSRTPPLDVLRWWFTLNYDVLRTTEDRLAFALEGQGVAVQSENQFLEANGKRRATGEANVANAEFAHAFTKHIAALAAKYPVYAELRNLCDLALAAELIKSERLGIRAGWSGAWFTSDAGYPVELAAAPKSVNTVVAHRVIADKHIVAAVSGGVRIDAAKYAASKNIRTDRAGTLATERKSAQPPLDAAANRWWWD